VSPLLFNVAPSDIRGPFTQFQLTVCCEADILNLMRSINGRLDDEQQLPDDVLKREFHVWWPKLKAKLDVIAKKQVDITHTSYDWLYTIEDLTRVHRTKARTSIWWITPNPFEYALTPSLKESIRDCIRRGVICSFIVPKSERSDDATVQLRRIEPGKPNGIQIVEIPSEEFHRAAVTDYIIIDPESDSTEVYLELPVTPRGYWIHVVNAESAGGFAARFRTLAHDHDKPLGRPRTASDLGSTA
jgi:hypothetical protein